MPRLTQPHIHVRKTATAPGSPYSFRIVREFFYLQQNSQHSRNCETGPLAYRPYPRRLDSLTICSMKLLRQHFHLSYLKTPSVSPVGVSNARPPVLQTGAQPNEQPVHGVVLNLIFLYYDQIALYLC